MKIPNTKYQIPNKTFQNSKLEIRNYYAGYIALTTVLIMGAVSTMIATSLLLLGLGHSRSALSENQMAQARGLADACAEDALRQIRLSTSYTGTSGLTLSTGTCSVTVTNTGGSTRSVTSSGTAGNNTRRVSITISALTPKITISQWQEIP